jgi:hypothetical protein
MLVHHRRCSSSWPFENLLPCSPCSVLFRHGFRFADASGTTLFDRTTPVPLLVKVHKSMYKYVQVLSIAHAGVPRGRMFCRLILEGFSRARNAMILVGAEYDKIRLKELLKMSESTSTSCLQFAIMAQASTPLRYLFKAVFSPEYSYPAEYHYQ